MPSFVSTTIPYSAPNQALTIKALEKRQADMLAAALKGGAITPENTQTPIQGFGHIANQLGDNFQAARAEQAAAARRAELSQVMAGMGPEGPSPQQLAQIHSADPELGAKLIQQQYEARQQQARFGHETGLQQGRFGQEDKTAAARVDAEKAAAADAAAVAEEARRAKVRDDEIARAAAAEQAEKAKVAEEARVGARPHSDAAKIADDVKSGKITPEQGDALIKKLSAPSATEAGKTVEAEQAYTQKQAMVDELERAEKALNEGINTGVWGGLKSGVAQATGGYVGDLAQAQRTEQVDNTMNKVATGAMSTILKGQSTDFEMKKFIAMYNNPKISMEEKRAQFASVLRAAKADAASTGAAVTRLGGDTKRIDETLKPGGAPAADPLEGKTATGPNGEKVVRRNGQWVPQ